jgi:hypothetical protein
MNVFKKKLSPVNCALPHGAVCSPNWFRLLNKKSLDATLEIKRWSNPSNRLCCSFWIN